MNEVSEKIPVTFTEAALTELRRISADNVDKMVRVGVKGGGCTGMTYILEHDEPEADDVIFELEDLKFLMKKAHGIYLHDMTIDFGTGLEARGFIFQNPNASETCGCGQSFAV